MNLLLLPKELKDLINEFNVEHRPKMKVVLNELLVKHNELTQNVCSNCGCHANKKYLTYIFWRKYKFCSEWCRYDIEYFYRNHSRMVL